MSECGGCEKQLDLLDVFPGGVCLDCHRVALDTDPRVGELVALAAFGP